MSVAAPAPPSRTWVLRPGLAVVRRDARTLQVGLHPSLTAQVSDTADVRALLAALRHGTSLVDLTPAASRARDSLLAAGLVFPATADRGSAAAATEAQYGADAARRRVARAAARVGLHADPQAKSVLAELIDELRADGTAIGFVSHDPALVAQLADDELRLGGAS